MADLNIQKFGTMAIIDIIHDVVSRELESTFEDRRKEVRIPLQPTLKASFYNNGLLHAASLVDISYTGGCFRCVKASSQQFPSLAIERTVEYYVTTLLGKSKCRGRIRWLDQNSDFFTWGIAFVELSPFDNDPLRDTITVSYQFNNPIHGGDEDERRNKTVGS